MKNINIVALTPSEFNYYESFEKVILTSILIGDEEDQKITVKIRKDVIEDFIKDHEAFADIPENKIKIVWV
jgi:hypothetical protein